MWPLLVAVTLDRKMFKAFCILSFVTIAATVQCPEGFVAMANGYFCCPTNVVNGYESEVCNPNRQCRCGTDNYSTMTDGLPGCGDNITEPGDIVCEPFYCPSTHPYTHRYGGFCCAHLVPYDSSHECTDSIDCPTNFTGFNPLVGYPNTEMLGLCMNATASPTEAPTEAPTRNPTPSTSPTEAPTEAPTRNPTPSTSKASSTLSTGAIIGIVVGTLVLLGLLLFFRRKSKLTIFSEQLL